MPTLDDMFREWLNRVDARIEYDNRRELASVDLWRWAFNQGMTAKEAIEDFNYNLGVTQ